MEVVYIVVLALQLLTQAKSSPSCGNDIVISPPNQIVRLGGNAAITCQLNRPGDGTFLWHFFAANLSTSDTSTTVLLDGVKWNESRQLNSSTLLITNIMHSDIGRYRCEKVNPPVCFSNHSSLTLFEKATIRLTSEQSEYRTYVGASLNLSAVVTGKPLPSTIRLEKLNQNFETYPDAKYSVIDLSTILIHRLSLEDSGKYRACVENSDNLIDCHTFEIVVQGLRIIPPMATVKKGDSLSVICIVINHDQPDDFKMIWQIMTTGDNLVNDSSARVTQVNTTDLRLVVDGITKPMGYSCVMQNSLRMIIAEHLIVDVIDVPGPPRDLSVQTARSSEGIYITWIAPETDNGSPLTAYYVTIIVEGGNSTVIPVLSSTTELNYSVGKCKVTNVTVTSENACGNSTTVEFSIDTRNQCVSSTEESQSDDNKNTLIAIGAGIAVVVIFVGLTILSIGIFVLWLQKHKRDAKHSLSLHDPESPSHVGNAKSQKPIVTNSPPPFIKRTTSIRRYRNLLEVSKDSVTLRDYLCDATHFDLRKAHLLLSVNDNKAHEVMVKIAKQSASSEEEHNIQEEIKMMSTVGNHENVVGLLRTCLSEPPVYLITEYFAHGDLLGFLRASRGHFGMYAVSPGTGYKTQPCAVQGQDLLRIATQVAAGMCYLAEKRITHRSLCARNVLVGTGLQVKVYNYGPKADSEATPPNYAKWMAPEMLFDGTANTMSDVWSFAVTFWEIITIGGSPYATTHPEQMRDLLQSGHRLPKPIHCDDALYSIMEQCWNHDPSIRPTFTTLHKQLDTMCNSKLSYLDSGLYNGDEYSEFEETIQLMTAL